MLEETGESLLSSQHTVSMRTGVNQTDHSRDTIGMDLDVDGNEPLPDTVRYKNGSVLKDEDQV